MYCSNCGEIEDDTYSTTDKKGIETIYCAICGRPLKNYLGGVEITTKEEGGKTDGCSRKGSPS